MARIIVVALALHAVGLLSSLFAFLKILCKQLIVTGAS
jgi:hypothetical protein